jgi:ABC-type multidrug transport system fused ATPase/permease subunit
MHLFPSITRSFTPSLTRSPHLFHSLTRLPLSLSSATDRAELENRMICVERMDEYATRIAQEPAWVLPSDSDLPAAWPHEGRIEFDNVTLRYREALEPALRGASATVGAHEKIGIAGARTAEQRTKRAISKHIFFQYFSVFLHADHFLS